MAYAVREPSLNPGAWWPLWRRNRVMILALMLSLVAHLLPLAWRGPGGRPAVGGRAGGLQVVLLTPANVSKPPTAPTRAVLALANPSQKTIPVEPASPAPQHAPRPATGDHVSGPAPPAMFTWSDFGSIGRQYYPWNVLDVLAMPQDMPRFDMGTMQGAQHYRVHLQLLIDELGGVNRVAIQDIDPANDADSDWVRQVVIRGFMTSHFVPAQMDGRPVRSLKDIEWTADASASSASAYLTRFGLIDPASAANAHPSASPVR